MIAAVVWLVFHIAAIVTILAAVTAVGQILLRNHPFESWLERAVFTLATGLGAAALAIFAAGLAGALHPRGILFTTLGAAAGALVIARRARRTRRQRDRSIEPATVTTPATAGLFLAAIAGGAVVWLVLAARTLYPPNEWDAVSHHLVLARYYLEDGQIAPALGVPYPLLPALHHMLLVWALAIGDDITAQMIEHVFLVLLALGMWLWGWRLGNRPLAFALAALPIGQPLMVWLSSTAYLDLEITLFVWLGFYALRVFRDGRDIRWWYLAMAMLGFAAGVRFQGLFFAAIGVLLSVVWRIRAGALLRGWAIGAAAGVPWYAFIAYHTGDPFWPAMPQVASGIWGTPRVILDAQAMFWSSLEPRTFVNFLRLPFDQIVHSRVFHAETNPPLLPLLVLWPIAWAVSFRDRSVRWWTLPSVAYLLFWFNGLAMMRFWLPAVPLVGCALYESLAWLMARWNVTARVRAAAWIGVGVLSIALGLAWTARRLVLEGPPPVTATSREAFLDTIEGYAAVRHVNRRAAATDVVYVVNASWLNYYFRPRIIDYVGILQHDNWPSFQWPADEAWIRSLDDRDVRWIVVRHDQSPDVLGIPSTLPASGSFWPSYQVAYQDETMWAFRRR